MTDSVKKNTVVFVTEETTEGTYVAPTVGTQAVQVLASGLAVTPSKELIERSIAFGGIGKVAGRPGQRSVKATVPVEFKAGSAEGAAPEYGLLMEAALGAKRSVATTTTASTSDGATGTASRVPLADADKNKYAVNDIVRVRRSGQDDHIGRISAVSNVNGAVSITLQPALASGSFGAGDVVSKVTTYYTADSGHPIVSLTKEIESSLVEKGIGCRVSAVALNNFSTGKIADWSFTMEGLDFDRVLAPTGVTPSFDSSTPPLILSASVFIDGVEVVVDEVALNVANALAFKTATNSSSGRVSSRITERTLTGSLKPYKQSDNIDLFTKFTDTNTFDLMLYAYNPGASATDKDEVCAIFIPNCLITEMSEADKNGLLQESISFAADQAKMYVSFI